MSVGQKKDADNTRPEPKGLRRVAYWFIGLCVVPALFFLSVEAGLRVFGYGYPMGYTFKQTVDGEEKILSNPYFVWKFFDPQMISPTFPFALPAKKPQDTYRVFVMGASAAKGFPASPYSMARILDKMLRDQYPTVNFEVVNTGRAAINSHVVVPIARTCSGLQPDLFVVYLGNNEVVGPYGAGTVFAPLNSSIPLIRTSANVRASRIGQLVQNTIQPMASAGDRPFEFRGMEMFVDSHVRASDPRMDIVYKNFERNLSDICRAGERVGADVIVATVGVNLKDSAPFGSLHREGLPAEALHRWEQVYNDGVEQEEQGNHRQAVDRYLDAERIDSEFADLHFRMARCFWALDDFANAKKRYEMARDLDTLRFRADTRLNEIIRRVAEGKADKGIYLAETEEAIQAQSPHGTPGEELFYDHVHLNFPGNYHTAKALFEQVQQILPEWVSGQSSGRPVLTEQECIQQLAFTGWDRLKTAESLMHLMQRPPFTNQLSHAQDMERLSREIATLEPYTESEGQQQALMQYAAAAQNNQADWELLFQYALLQMAAGESPEKAVKNLQVVNAEVPQFVTGSLALGSALMRQKKYDEAMKYFNRALTYAPKSTNVLRRNGEEQVKIGQFTEGIGYYERAIEVNPFDKLAHNALADAMMRRNSRDPDHQKIAIDHYQKAIAIDPDYAMAHFSLATVLLRQAPEDPQNQKSAIEHYRKVIEINPEYAPAHFNLANALLVHKREDPEYQKLAIEHYQKALALAPEMQSARKNLELIKRYQASVQATQK